MRSWNSPPAGGKSQPAKRVSLSPGADIQGINRRYTRSSTIVTSNKRVTDWGTLLRDEILAATILDRLLHDAEVLTIDGPSWRLRGRNEILDGPRQPKHRNRLGTYIFRRRSTDNFRCLLTSSATHAPSRG